jgi:hypothetical protein
MPTANPTKVKRGSVCSRLSAKKPNTNPPATDAAMPDPTPINVHRLGGFFGTVRLPGVHGLHATITQRQLLVDIDGDG